MKIKLLTTFFTVVVCFSLAWLNSSAQGVAINATGNSPDPKAMLDVSGNGAGILIPRMDWANRPSGLTSTQDGLLIYSTDGNGIDGTGYYYWDGVTLTWKKLFAGTSWSLSGNTLSGTLPASPIEWIGSINAADWIIKSNNTERMRIVSIGNVGIGTGATVNTKLDINGSIAWREGTALNLIDGTNNDVALDDYSFYRITGPTAAFTITGISGGKDGRIVTLYNTTTQAMTIANNSSSSATAGNRIYTLTGTDLTTPAGPNIIQLQWNANVSRWIIIGGQNYLMSLGSGSNANTLIYTVNGF